jgi:nucleotide-binding universal stress UspA family protein
VSATPEGLAAAAAAREDGHEGPGGPGRAGRGSAEEASEVVDGQIVVGVDGSEGSRRALRWALEEARCRRLSLVAVGVWESPYEYGFDEVPPPPGRERELAETARHRLEAALEEVGEEARAGVAIEARVVEGRPAKVFCELSDEASLLVLGARGHGGFAGLLLGSVSTECAHHSRCPVVIVPRSKGPDGAER